MWWNMIGSWVLHKVGAGSFMDGELETMAPWNHGSSRQTHPRSVCMILSVPSALQTWWKATSLSSSSAGRWRFSHSRPSTFPPCMTWPSWPHEGNRGGPTPPFLHKHMALNQANTQIEKLHMAATSPHPHLKSHLRRASRSPRPAGWGWQEASAPFCPERKYSLSSSPLLPTWEREGTAGAALICIFPILTHIF